MLKKIKLLFSKVLPTQFSESLSYYEEICKLTNKLNEVIEAVNAGQTFYILPVATPDKLGGIKAENVTNENTKIAVDVDGMGMYKYPPSASPLEAGLVKTKLSTGENETVAIDPNGVAKYNYPEYATDETAGISKMTSATEADDMPVAIDENGNALYRYPKIATNSQAGIVKAKNRSNETGEVVVDDNGKLYYEEYSYTLPHATATHLGGIKASAKGENDTVEVKIGSNDKLYVAPQALPIATDQTLGGVKAKVKTTENVEVAVDVNGKLFTPAPSIPIANATTIGGVKGRAKTSADTQEVSIDADGKMYVGQTNVPQASENQLGVVKAKTRTTEDRKVSIDPQDGFLYIKDHTLQQATENTLGGIKAAEKTNAETEEVKIDTVSGKLYSKPTAYVLPVANTNTLGGVMANTRNPSVHTQEVTIGSDNKLYTAPYTLAPADKTNLGGLRVADGGEESSDLSRQGWYVESFVPNSSFPYAIGKRTPYSCDFADGKFKTYNTEIEVNLTDESAESITKEQLHNCLEWLASKYFNHYIYAEYVDDDLIIVPSNKYYFSELNAGDKVYTSLPYSKNGSVYVAVLRVWARTDEDHPEPYYIEEFDLLGNSYTLPQATANALGGIKAEERTTESQEVKIDTSTGKLYCKEINGSTLTVHEYLAGVTTKNEFYENYPEFPDGTHIIQYLSADDSYSYTFNYARHDVIDIYETGNDIAVDIWYCPFTKKGNGYYTSALLYVPQDKDEATNTNFAVIAAVSNTATFFPDF